MTCRLFFRLLIRRFLGGMLFAHIEYLGALRYFEYEYRGVEAGICFYIIELDHYYVAVRVDDREHLYWKAGSIGLDDKAFTQDDIYPKVDANNKYGLIDPCEKL